MAAAVAAADLNALGTPADFSDLRADSSDQRADGNFER